MSGLQIIDAGNKCLRLEPSCQASISTGCAVIGIRKAAKPYEFLHTLFLKEISNFLVEFLVESEHTP